MSFIFMTLRSKKNFFFFFILLAPQWGAADAEIKSHLVRTQSLNVLPLKPGVGQSIAMHVMLTARDFLLISTLPVHSPVFFPRPLPIFSCVG